MDNTVSVQITWDDLSDYGKNKIMERVKDRIWDNSQGTLTITDKYGEVIPEDTEQYLENIASYYAGKSWIDWTVDITGAPIDNDWLYDHVYSDYQDFIKQEVKDKEELDI